MSETELFMPLVEGIQTSVEGIRKEMSMMNGAISNNGERISKLEAKLDNGLRSDIKDIKTGREKDKEEAIEARKKEREIFLKAINDRYNSCPNTKILTKKEIAKGIILKVVNFIKWAIPIGFTVLNVVFYLIEHNYI